jgi:Flp pilus assembly protein TadG
MAAVNNKLKIKLNRRYLGTSTLEAAFVLILLLIVTLGSMGFGWLFFRIQQVTNATRHGARIAIRYGAQQSDVQNAVAALLDPVGLEYQGPEFPTGTDPSLGEAVTVRITGTALDILNLDSATILGIPIPDEFTASVTMAKEGP